MTDTRRGGTAARWAVAAVALALAASSAAHAVDLTARSVGTKQLAKGAVTSVKVKDHTLRQDDFRPGVLVGAAGPAGPAGTAGPAGPPGPARGTAYIQPDGLLIRASGELELITVFQPEVGVYCIDNTQPGLDTWMVDTSFPDRFITANPNPGTPAVCVGYPTDLLVRVWDLANAPANAGFILAIL